MPAPGEIYETPRNGRCGESIGRCAAGACRCPAGLGPRVGAVRPASQLNFERYSAGKCFSTRVRTLASVVSSITSGMMIGRGRGRDYLQI
jgi:hypothetical protein